MGGARSKSSKGVVDFRPYVTRSIPVGAQIVCADNTGAGKMSRTFIEGNSFQ